MAQISSPMGKTMYLLAWLCGLALLVFVFQDLLDEQINPNQQPRSEFQNGQAVVYLQRNRAGHYVVDGEINGQQVTFMVDTGATNVSIPAHLQQQLALTPRGQGIARTANGTVPIKFTQINNLTIGDIKLRDVPASLNPGMQSDQILLGMSVLRQLEFTQRGDTLILKTL